MPVKQVAVTIIPISIMIIVVLTVAVLITMFIVTITVTVIAASSIVSSLTFFAYIQSHVQVQEEPQCWSGKAKSRQQGWS